MMGLDPTEEQQREGTRTEPAERCVAHTSPTTFHTVKTQTTGTVQRVDLK